VEQRQEPASISFSYVVLESGEERRAKKGGSGFRESKVSFGESVQMLGADLVEDGGVVVHRVEEFILLEGEREGLVKAKGEKVEGEAYGSSLKMNGLTAFDTFLIKEVLS
jgi:hypothetical protein